MSRVEGLVSHAQPRSAPARRVDQRLSGEGNAAVDVGEIAALDFA
jgi:hypothetical protein